MRDGVERIDYPQYWKIPEHVALQDFRDDELQPLYRRKYQLEDQLRINRQDYDTSLLEEIAESDKPFYGGIDEVQTSITDVREELSKLEKEISVKEEMAERLEEKAEDAFEPMKLEYEKKMRIRQAKVFGLEALFWLPFFLVVLFWHVRTKKKNSSWEVVSIAALLAACAVSLHSVIVFIWSLVPKMFLEKLWEFLQVTVFTRVIGYYILILIPIVLFGALIVIVHRKLTDPVLWGKKKIKNGDCPKCNYPLSLSGNFCGGCGRVLKKKCPSCNAEGFEWQSVCTSCGKESSEN